MKFYYWYFLLAYKANAGAERLIKKFSENKKNLVNLSLNLKVSVMKKVFILLALMIFTWVLQSQVYPFTSDYLLSIKSLIPAAGAEDNFLSIVVSYDKKWVLPASPNRANIYANLNFRKHGFNRSSMRTEQVIFYSSAVQLGYYYKMMIKNFHVNFGVNGLYLQDRLDVNKLDDSYQSDPAFEQLPQVANYPQIGLSSFVFTDKFEFGFSVANILKARGYNYGNLNIVYPLSFNVYGSIFYKHPLNYYLLKAQLYSFYSLDKKLLIEPSAIFVIKNFIKAGGLINYYMQSNTHTVGTGLILGLRLKDRVVVNYVLRYILIGRSTAYTRMDNGLSITFNIYHKSEIVPRYF